MPNDPTVRVTTQTDPTEPLTGTEYFQRAIGGSHKPAVLGKYTASHPTAIRRVYEEALTRHPEAADVIAALVFWRGVDRNRDAFLREARTDAE